MANFDAETAKYLFNPVNKRVVINSELKRRVSPKLIPCNKLDASDIAGDPVVLMANNEPHEPVSEEEAQLSEGNVEGGFSSLRLTIESSEDNAELRQIGGDLAVVLSKSMKIPAMRKKLFDRIEELEATST